MALEPRIQILPPELASQIAAGEVVERPASAVKELIENALDAEASRVDVEADAGGVSRICVRDDGHGMSEADAKLCLERHATSKLRSATDLERVNSFGFRGEALPSIASVSRLSLRTRPRDQDAGLEVIVNVGSPIDFRPVGMNVGTQVEVKDLFFNVPARRKFLRSTGTEAGHIAEVVENAALAREGVTFTLTRDGRLVREFLRAADREERVRQVIDGELAPCTGDKGPLRITAFLGRPEAARAGAAALRLFVNGRSVRDRGVLVAIAQAYGSVLERGRYPIGAVYLDLPPELVDVNVHPQKAEVRFADPRAVGDAVYSVLGRALSHAFSLPNPSRGSWSSAPRGVSTQPPAESPAAAPEGLRAHSYSPSNHTGPHLTSSPPERTAQEPSAYPASSPPLPPPLVSGTVPASRTEGQYHLPIPRDSMFVLRDSHAPQARLGDEPRWSSLRFVAQLKATYLLCEGEAGIYLLDQHAAAERVTFAKLRQEYHAAAVSTQTLLFPVTLDVSAEEAEALDQHSEEIQKAGLDARVRASNQVSIHGVPKLLQRATPERLLRDLLSELMRKNGRAFSDAVDLAFATMACHGSVRAGDPLAAEEARALLLALETAEFAGHCPHGRPIVMFLSWAELDRKVGRR